MKSPDHELIATRTGDIGDGHVEVRHGVRNGHETLLLGFRRPIGTEIPFSALTPLADELLDSTTKELTAALGERLGREPAPTDESASSKPVFNDGFNDGHTTATVEVTEMGDKVLFEYAVLRPRDEPMSDAAREWFIQYFISLGEADNGG